MAWQWAIPAAVQGATTVARYLSRPRIRSFANTKYGQALATRQREGMYSPDTRRKMLGQAGSTLGNIAGMERSNIRGQLVGSGMSGSIAGVRAMAEPGRERLRKLSDYGTRIDIENELDKKRAEE